MFSNEMKSELQQIRFRGSVINKIGKDPLNAANTEVWDPVKFSIILACTKTLDTLDFSNLSRKFSPSLFGYGHIARKIGAYTFS